MSRLINTGTGREKTRILDMVSSHMGVRKHTRRRVLTAAGMGTVTVLAGCTEDDSLDDSDWHQLHRWLEAARFTIEDARFKFQQWFADPDSVPTVLIELLRMETRELLLEYREEIDPLTFDLPDGTVTVSGEDWVLDGDSQQINRTVMRTGMLLGHIDDACVRYTEVDGNPDAVGSTDDFDAVIDEGRDRIEEVEAIVLSGRLDHPSPG